MGPYATQGLAEAAMASLRAKDEGLCGVCVRAGAYTREQEQR